MPNQAPPAGAPSASPFVIAQENPAPSPFTTVPAAQPQKASPFTVVATNDTPNDLRATRLPERRKPSESPFDMAEPQAFGFEASAPPQKPAQASPFTIEQPAPAPAPVAVQAPAPAPVAFEVPAPAPVAFQAPAPAPAPAAFQAPAPAPFSQPQAQPASVAGASFTSDSFQIKQLELRAIFGVDREMSKEEIIQRSRSLPGVRQIAQVSDSDIAAVDALKHVIANLGFGSAPLKLYSGSVPIDFIREGNALLAVQTDGGYAPGVRETLMIVARELSR
jgi:hypothetical protein